MNDKSQNLKFDTTQLTGMPLDEALSVVWPFRGIGKPIGISLEQGDITIRDVAWASENSFYPRVKQAARTILVARLLPDKMKPSLLPAQIIQGKNYASQQRKKAIIFQSLALGILVGFSIILISTYFVTFLWKQLVGYKEFISNIYGIIFFILLPIVVSFIGNKYGNEGELYRIGEEAENQSVNALHALLHEPWVIVHNFSFPDRKWGDIDLIVVGVGGIWAIEVKGYTSSVRNIGDRWQYKNKYGWRKLGGHPGKQVRQNAKRLYDYLDLKGVKPSWVQPIVLWAGDDIQIENPETPVWKLSDLPINTEFWKNNKFTVEQVDRIKSVLQETLASTKK